MKGVIVLDNYPEKCEECRFGNVNGEKVECDALNLRFFTDTGKKTKRCPIRPMPERYYNTSKELFKAYWEIGWNACITQLEKEA